LKYDGHVKRSALQSMVISLTLAFIAPGLAHAQAAPAGSPVFDIAYVKANTSNEPTSIGPLPGRLVATNVPLRLLVQFAYRRPNGKPFLNNQISGGPRWLDTERFDVQGKVEGRTVPFEQLVTMLQRLLEDRFHLQTHRETREAPVYTLVHLKNSAALTLADDQTPVVNNGPRRLPGPNEPQPRGTLMPSRSSDGNLVLSGSAVPMSSLANALEGYVDRPVIDATSLQGLFDLRLEFGRPLSTNPDAASSGAPGGAPVPDLSAPVLFTAIQEQLGLKLESRKGPVEVLVIDQAERPTTD
jgi:uncharacterized protein (TIGR03435 family)